MIFVVIYVYVMYILYPISSGANIPKRKPTVQRRKKVKRLKVLLSGCV